MEFFIHVTTAKIKFKSSAKEQYSVLK